MQASGTILSSRSLLFLLGPYLCKKARFKIEGFVVVQVSFRGFRARTFDTKGSIYGKSAFCLIFLNDSIQYVCCFQAGEFELEKFDKSSYFQ